MYAVDCGPLRARRGHGEWRSRTRLLQTRGGGRTKILSAGRQDERNALSDYGAIPASAPALLLSHHLRPPNVLPSSRSRRRHREIHLVRILMPSLSIYHIFGAPFAISLASSRTLCVPTATASMRYVIPPRYQYRIRPKYIPATPCTDPGNHTRRGSNQPDA